MNTAVNGWFELVEVLLIAGLFLIMAPILIAYWSQSIVTYTDDKTSFDTQGTISVIDDSDIVLQCDMEELLLLCYVMGDNLDKSEDVRVTINGSTFKLSPDTSSDWESEKLSLLKSIWSKAYSYKGASALDLNFSAIYVPGTSTIQDGSTTSSSEGYWSFTID